MSSTLVRRQIGRWATAARAGVGIGLLALEVVLGVDALDALLGFVLFPSVELVVLGVLRRRDAPPLRAGGPRGHALSIMVFAALVTWQPDAAFLFYGASMLIAAWRGFGACEIFAISKYAPASRRPARLSAVPADRPGRSAPDGPGALLLLSTRYFVPRIVIHFMPVRQVGR